MCGRIITPVSSGALVQARLFLQTGISLLQEDFRKIDEERENHRQRKRDKSGQNDGKVLWEKADYCRFRMFCLITPLTVAISNEYPCVVTYYIKTNAVQD